MENTKHLHIFLSRYVSQVSLTVVKPEHPPAPRPAMLL